MPAKTPRDENFPVASLVLGRAAARGGSGLLPLRAQGRRHRRRARSLAGRKARAARCARGRRCSRAMPRFRVAARLAAVDTATRRRHRAGAARCCAPSGRMQQRPAMPTGTSFWRLLPPLRRPGRPLSPALHGEDESVAAPADALCDSLADPQPPAGPAAATATGSIASTCRFPGSTWPAAKRRSSRRGTRPGAAPFSMRRSTASRT